MVAYHLDTSENPDIHVEPLLPFGMERLKFKLMIIIFLRIQPNLDKSLKHYILIYRRRKGMSAVDLKTVSATPPPNWLGECPPHMHVTWVSPVGGGGGAC